MPIRPLLIAFALAMTAMPACAAVPHQPQAPAAAAANGARHARACEKRSRLGKCEKWSAAVARPRPIRPAATH